MIAARCISCGPRCVTQGLSLIAAIAVITLRLAGCCHGGEAWRVSCCSSCRSTQLYWPQVVLWPHPTTGTAESESAGLSCVQKAEGQDIWEEHMDDYHRGYPFLIYFPSWFCSIPIFAVELIEFYCPSSLFSIWIINVGQFYLLVLIVVYIISEVWAHKIVTVIFLLNARYKTD